MISHPAPLPAFGLTGGAASGKSTVAAYFGALGASVIDADRIGHALLLRSGAAYADVVRRFGDQIIGADGEINRAALGRIIFAEPSRRADLNAILHPLIVREQRERAAEIYAANPQAVILIEAALIYEARVENQFRKIVVAWSTRAQQIERLKAKGISARDAESRLSAQMPADEKRRRADFVIDCSGSLDQVRAQVAALYPQLQQIAISG